MVGAARDFCNWLSDLDFGCSEDFMFANRVVQWQGDISLSKCDYDLSVVWFL